MPVQMDFGSQSNSSPSSNWNDWDLTSYFGDDAGNVIAVIIETDEGYGFRPSYGLRKNGSEDEFVGLHGYAGQSVHVVPIDSNDIIERYSSSTSTPEFRLCGYIVAGEGAFQTNATEKTPTTGSWQDVDLSTETSSSGLVAFFQLDDTGGSTSYSAGIRRNGSGDSFSRTHGYGHVRSFLMNLDENYKCEIWRGNTQQHWYFMGYLSENADGQDNATNKSTGTTGSWQEVDCSGQVPVGYDAALMVFHPTVDTRYNKRWRVYNNTSREYDSGTGEYNEYFWAPLDSSRKGEQNVTSTNMDLYLFGWTSPPSSGEDIVKVIDETSNVTEGEYFLRSKRMIIGEDPKRVLQG